MLIYMNTFHQVNPINNAGLMLDIMKMELNKFANVKTKFIEEFSIHDYNYIEQVFKHFFLSKNIHILFSRAGRTRS